MNIEELEEILEEALQPGFSIETDKHGQIVILTGLKQDDDGELVPVEDDEVDPDADPDFESLEDDIDDD